MYQWRRFPFFDRLKVSDTNEENNALETLKKMKIACSSSGHSKILFGDDEALIHVFDSNYQEVMTFKSYGKKITHLLQMKSRNILLGLGRDDEDPTPILKIWDMAKVDKHNNPSLCKTIKIVSKFQTSDATKLAVSDDLSRVAIGFANGAVVLISGHDISLDKSPKSKNICKPSGDSITGLGFRDYKDGIVLFISDKKSVRRCIPTEDKFPIVEIEANGAELNCNCMSEDKEFVVGKEDSVFLYDPEGRTNCVILEEKTKRKYLLFFKEYLVVTSQPAEDEKFNAINIYNLKNKFIAFNISSCPAISQIFVEFGAIHFVNIRGEMYRVEEKDTETKLKTLISKNLFTVAINLAKDEKYDANSIIDIQRKYGDHLYSKGEFDAAITRYVETIGFVEPSYVIRRFLDAQRIHNLTSYLQALHEKQLANSDHTTLLLNCYTKLKDVNKLNDFVRGEDDRRLNFEVETAIRVCTQAGYHEHALYLAQKHNEHQWYLKIILENLGNYEQALEYIWTLPHYEAEKNIKKHGRFLISKLSDQTTDLIIQLCTSYTPKKENDQENKKFREKSATTRSNWEEFIYIFVDQEDCLIRFLEVIGEKLNDISSLLYHTLLDLYLRPIEGEENLKKKEEREGKAFTLLVNKRGKYEEDYVLVMCHNYQFAWGYLYLYQSMQLYSQIMQYYMKNNSFSQVLEVAKKYSKNDPNLWIEALTYYAGVDEGDCEEEIKEVLAVIDKEDLLPPIRVIQILSQKKTCSLSVVKNYIIEKLNKENNLIDKDKRETHKLKEETKRMKVEIEELRTGARIFQQNKCAICENALDLPAVHFLCLHSLHIRCLFENENECPKCAPTIRHPKYYSEQVFNEHDEYFRNLQDSNSGFFVMAEYFGKGIFNDGSNINNTTIPIPKLNN